MVTSHKRGHLIIYDGNQWVYVDTKEPIDIERPCARCGRMPTAEGYDVCFGYIPGAVSVCCGHGVEEGYVVMEQEVT